MEAIDLRPECEGRFSRVLSYGWGEQRLALKMVPSSNKRGCDQLKSEFAMLQTLNHPNIIKAFKLKDIGGTVGHKQMSQLKQPQSVLVLEFANKGSLFHFIQKQHPKIYTLRILFQQIARALAYTHSLSVAHRDIKLENILVVEKNGEIQAKLGDFGLASRCLEKGKQKTFNEFRGSEMYMAPEIWKARQYKQARYEILPCDIFALGVTLFAMIYGRMPFRKAVVDDQLYGLLVRKKEDQFWRFHGNPVCFQTFPTDYIQNFRELFASMVNLDPKQRPSITALISHSYLTRQV